MKYLKAILYLLFGLIEAIVMFPISLFIIPVNRYNQALYGKNKTQARVVEYDDKIHIILPNGDTIVAVKTKRE